MTAPTYQNMQDRIADEVDDSTAQLTTQIQRAILSAIKHYERMPFYFNSIVTDTFALVANQEYYGSAANSKIPNLIEIRDLYFAFSDGSRWDLSVATNDDIAASQNGLIVADPTHYAYVAQQIRMFPIPANARTVTAYWVYRLTALSVGSDSNAWTDDAEELIRLKAKGVLARDVTKDDDELVRLAPWEKLAYDALIAETRRRKSSPRLRTDVPLHRPRFNINTGYP